MRLLLRSAFVLTTVLALALGVRAVEAGPVLSASENPVVIPSGQTTKSITLTWNLGGTTSVATVMVTESGNPAPVPLQLVSSPPDTGSVPLTVTYGKTYTAQLNDTLTGIQLGAPLTITTTRSNQDGGSGCTDQCTLNVAVTPHATWAQFTATTSETAIITIEASTKQPNANGTWSNPADVAGFAGTILPTKTFKPEFPITGGSLTPNTTYYYVVRAHFSGGNEVVKTGSFKTLKQQVTVSFTDLTVTDDSDDLSACDCFFWFKVGDAAPLPYGSYANQLNISSGSTVHPNVTFTIANSPAQLKLGVQGTDDDTDFGQFCPYGTGADPNWGSSWTSSGSDSCRDWAANTKTVTLPTLAVGETQQSASFSLAANGSALKFTVSGTLTVTEAP